MTGQVTAYVSQIVTPDHVTGQVTFPRSRAGKGPCYEGRFVTAGGPTAAAALACGGDQDAAVADPASNNEATLVGTLLNSLSMPETRKSVLVSLMSAGTDALDAVRHSLSVLFILCVVLLLFTFFCPLSLL